MSTTVSDSTSTEPKFSDLPLPENILATLTSLGYETPTPIQALTIPPMAEGKDVVGQAQTGTGKTAAFALPLLSRIDPDIREPQALILAPTRELAIQVCEALDKYAGNVDGFQSLAIYGGQDYGIQLRALRRGVQVVVGTPGRVMDHMRRGTLKLDSLHCLILDEADEMLRMGFIDDVEWILEQTPVQHQIALFSATMPPAIRRIAQKYLSNPEQLTVQTKTTTATTITQKYWPVQGSRKFAALARILEGETTDGVIIFVRTKSATVEVAEKLSANGYRASALNGDIPQNQRERTIDRLKSNHLDILVATDVAARGLDVERITHVVNYDLSRDPEIYVHRIGRTGRAGREGVAISFVSGNENHLLRQIERTTRKKIDKMELPSVDDINAKRMETFKEKITRALSGKKEPLFLKLVQEFQEANGTDPLELAAALAQMAQGDKPLLMSAELERTQRSSNNRRDSFDKRDRRSDKPFRQRRGRDGGGRDVKPFRERSFSKNSGAKNSSDKAENYGKEKAPTRNFDKSDDSKPDKGMERFQIQVGRTHGVKPGNIVGAIANEAGLDNTNIGRINIFDQHSTVDLPAGMPREIFKILKRTRVSGQQLRIARTDGPKKSYTK